MSESQNTNGFVHLLSFDVEEYFQVEAASASGVTADQWDSFPRRLAQSVDGILSLLREHQTQATFFVLGWVARHGPEIVRKIAAEGHEVASHGMNHQMITRMEPEPFREDLRESRSRLEDLAGRRVLGYRAPTFSILRRTSWALDILAEEGYEYDSSVFPVRHDRYGVPEAPRWAHRAIGPAGNAILEIPPLTRRVCGTNVPVGGGGYMRLFPNWLLSSSIRKAQQAQHSAMIYLHPWEFDPGQPVLPMGRLSRWRHRVNLHRTAGKLQSLLKAFRFGSVQQQLPDLKRTTLTMSY